MNLTRLDRRRLSPAVIEALTPLTPFERRFVEAYCGPARGKAVVAAGMAGYKGTYAARASRGSGMRHDPRVAAAIEAVLEAYALTGADVTARLKDLAEANVGPFTELQADGTLRVKLADDQTWETHRHWIKAVECDPETGRVIRVVLHDAARALHELAKILKLYSDAPVWAPSFHLHLQQMSDEDLIRQREELRAALRSTAVLGRN